MKFNLWRANLCLPDLKGGSSSKEPVERVFPKQPIFGFSKSVTMFFKETKLSRGKVVSYLLDQYLVEK